MAAGADLVFPRRCFLCHRRYAWLCGDCRTAIVATGPLTRLISVDRAPALPVVSAVEATEAVLRLLTAYKDASWGILAPHLADIVRTNVSRDRDHLRDGSGLRDGDVVRGFGDGTYWVPVPQTRAGFRRRGWHPLPTLLRRLGVKPVPLLGFARQPAEQSRLSRTQRRDNVAGSMRARNHLLPSGARVIIIDDIVTTGSTLAEAARALFACGLRRVSAVTVASVPRQVGPRDIA